ncbi:MAG TPA: two-component sensor histidine kinase [Rhodobacteraceae bacterium]|jgi:two-component system osmolarity sensor histidine kinase EnvZ|nr:two-component sensor histidine kinase [Paracoccaceae bacterium]
MNFKWLKRYMPRSLYGRAALILILPIVVIQLVVSVVFIQRLYEDVTRQMSQNMVLELGYLLDQVNQAPDLATAMQVIEPLQASLALQIVLPAATKGVERRGFADLSGRVITQTLRAGLEGVQAVDLLSQRKKIHLWMTTRHGSMQVGFDRLRVSARNPHQLLVLMLVTGVLMTVIAIIFLRNQLRPIKRLASASEAFGKGHIAQYSPRGATEVRAAGAAFLSMRARIERQIEQRTMMLSGVSHDLRTPLTRLKLGLSLMEPCSEVDDLKQDVADMQGLLDGFLDFAQGDAGEQPQEIDPVDLLRHAVENACRAGKDVAVSQVKGAPVKMMLRPVAISRALDNLIGNAVRYGTQARVGVVFNDRNLVISVEDNGPGIAKADREKALQPFSRLVPARNQNKGSGVGLGLSIALDIARTHGGNLRLGESETMGGLKADLILTR